MLDNKIFEMIPFLDSLIVELNELDFDPDFFL
jgi:hypothetical protein